MQSCTDICSIVLEQPEKGSSVPRFGEWDESDPSSADNFTGIFNKVREEKKSGSAAMVINDTVYVNDQDRRSGSLVSCLLLFICYNNGSKSLSESSKKSIA